jgi:hypothetical protein
VDQNPPTSGGGDLWSLARLDYRHHVLLHEAFDKRSELRKREIPLTPRRPWPGIDSDRPELGMTLGEHGTPLEPDEHYFDPLAEHDPRAYAGPWLAGFAQVANTELMVVVQQRYDAAIGHPTSLAKRFVWWGWGTLATAFFLAGIAAWKRRGTDRAKP